MTERVLFKPTVKTVEVGIRKYTRLYHFVFSEKKLFMKYGGKKKNVFHSSPHGAFKYTQHIASSGNFQKE